MVPGSFSKDGKMKKRKFYANPGDKVVKGMAVAEIISEGYFTLISEWDGRVKELYVSEGEYVEVDAPLMEITLNEEKKA